MPSSTLESITAEPPLLAGDWPRLRLFLEAWRRFRRHRAAMAGLALLLTLGLVCLAAPLFTAEDPARQSLARALRPPSWEHPLGMDHLGRDIRGANALGIISVWMNWSPRRYKTPADSLEVPRYTIQSPAEFLSLLEQLEATRP